VFSFCGEGCTVNIARSSAADNPGEAFPDHGWDSRRPDVAPGLWLHPVSEVFIGEKFV
jgi:hypothetical protein